MVLNMRAIGKKTSSMAMVVKCGLMVLPLKVIMLMGENKVKELLPGLIAPHTQETLMRIIFKAKECINGQMVEYIRELGIITRCMDMECSPGQMAGGMKEIIVMTRSRVEALSNGVMVGSILGVGIMGNSMELEFILAIVDNRERESGI